jgi:hypothetical protein
MNVQEKSDCAVVPVNQPNNEGLLQRRLGREGRRLRRTSFNLTCARHRAGKRMFQRLRGVWQAARFALPPCIHSKSRMRQRACTDLCGGRRVIGVPTATTGRARFWEHHHFSDNAVTRQLTSGFMRFLKTGRQARTNPGLEIKRANPKSNAIVKIPIGRI